MTFIVIIIIGCLGLLLMSYLRKTDNDIEWFIKAWCYCFVWMILLVLIFNVLVFTSKTEKALSKSVEITALQDSATSSGSFYLGSGQVEGDMMYYFMRDTDKGQNMMKAKAGQSFIKEGDYEPHVKIYDEVYTNKLVVWLLGEEVMEEEVEYVFYLPEGTVTSDFKIDLE